jgi:glycosyltransferase involved in cell wall biosynthesis
MHQAPVAGLPPYSVVIPNFNHARYLEAALAAHLGQTVPPLEIIVVDDASSDASVAIVERLVAEHSCLRLIRLATNSGVNAAINRGLREARGAYVKISAADDVVAADLAARSLEILARYPTAGLCSCDAAVLVGESGTIQPFPQFVSDRPCLLLPGDIVRLVRHNLIGFSSNTVLYRRDALLAAGGFIEELGWLADSFANYVLAFRHGACYVPEVLGWFRLLPDSYSARAARDTQAHREALYRILDLLQTPAFQDVAPAFRASTIVAFMTPSPLRAVPWLLAAPRHRAFLTPRLAARLLCFGPWSVVRGWIPRGWRQAARRLAARPMRGMLAGRLAASANDRERG